MNREEAASPSFLLSTVVPIRWLLLSHRRYFPNPFPILLIFLGSFLLLWLCLSGEEIMDASIRLQCPKVACISREMCFSKFRIFLAHFKCFSKPTFLESSWKCAQLPSPLSSSSSSSTGELSSSPLVFSPFLLFLLHFFWANALSLTHTRGKKGLEGGWVGSVASSSLFFLRSLSPPLPLFPRSSNAVLRSCRRCGARLKNSFINHNSYFEYGGGKRRKGRAGWEEDQILSSPSPSPLWNNLLLGPFLSLRGRGASSFLSRQKKERRKSLPSPLSPFLGRIIYRYHSHKKCCGGSLACLPRKRRR